MANIPIGLQLHTVREQLAEDPVQPFRQLRKSGTRESKAALPEG